MSTPSGRIGDKGGEGGKGGSRRPSWQDVRSGASRAASGVRDSTLGRMAADVLSRIGKYFSEKFKAFIERVQERFEKVDSAEKFGEAVKQTMGDIREFVRGAAKAAGMDEAEAEEAAEAQVGELKALADKIYGEEQHKGGTADKVAQRASMRVAQSVANSRASLSGAVGERASRRVTTDTSGPAVGARPPLPPRRESMAKTAEGGETPVEKFMRVNQIGDPNHPRVLHFIKQQEMQGAKTGAKKGATTVETPPTLRHVSVSKAAGGGGLRDVDMGAAREGLKPSAERKPSAAASTSTASGVGAALTGMAGSPMFQRAQEAARLEEARVARRTAVAGDEDNTSRRTSDRWSLPDPAAGLSTPNRSRGGAPDSSSATGGTKKKGGTGKKA